MRLGSPRLGSTIALAALGLVAALAGPAVAWVPFRDGAGRMLAWPADTTLDVALGVAPPGLSPSDVHAVVELAFDAWLEHDECHPPARGPIRSDNAATLDETDHVTAIVFFTDRDAWAARALPKDLARTFVKFDPTTGAITDADIAVNTANFVFDATPSEACSPSLYDLRAALTHEVGHVLGLDHSDVASATMDAHEFSGVCDKRALDPDDLAGLCALYAPTTPPEVEADGGPEDAQPESVEAVAAPARGGHDDCAGGGSSLAALAAPLVICLRRARRSNARCPRGPCPSRARS